MPHGIEKKQCGQTQSSIDLGSIKMLKRVDHNLIGRISVRETGDSHECR